MGEILTLTLLGFALSLDSFTAGFTFGLRKISISIRAIFTIGVVTASVFFLALLIGDYLSQYFSERMGDIVGGSLFIGIGLWVLYQFFREKKVEKKNDMEPIVFKWEIKSLGIVIQILKDPDHADFDRSGDIRGWEAIILGTALSLDAFGAGIGAAMLGLVPLLTAFFVASMSSLFLWLGTKSGFLLASCHWVKNIAFIPGLILIILGCLKLS